MYFCSNDFVFQQQVYSIGFIMSLGSVEDSYTCIGYANKSVKKDFKYFFRKISSLTEAVDTLLSQDNNLYSKYKFMEDDVKYKLRARASSLDDPATLHESLLV